jgi:hypothetical protein
MGSPTVIQLADSRRERALSRTYRAGGSIADHHRIPAVALLGWTLLCLCGVVIAEETPGPVPAEVSAPDDQPGLVLGYDATWQGENPTNIDTDLDSSFPQKGAIFDTNIPKSWFAWKEDLYSRRGLKLGFSYQSLYQTTTDSQTAEDTAWGGWLLIEAKWDAINRGGDYQGSLVAALDWRHNIAGTADPAFFQLQTGSLWATDFLYLEWDPWFPSLYWEQRLNKDKFVVRVGNQAAAQFIDFFRYKDGRTSFTGSPFTVAPASIPAPPPGFATSFRWTPLEDSEFYVVGTLNDMNADVDEFDWGNVVDHGQFFYGIEFGKNWRRGKGDFDHLHLLLFYADEVDSSPAFFPNKAGGGFKIAGEKQWDRLVGFGSYTHNSAEGASFGATLVKQTLNAGFAVNRPLNVGGEVGIGFTWAEPIDGIRLFGQPQRQPPKDQYGVEFYWKVLVTEDLWVTPSLQVIINPTYNPTTESIIVPGLKARLFF